MTRRAERGIWQRRYWAHLRYPAPLAQSENPEPYQQDDNTGPFPSYRHTSWVEILRDAATITIDETGHFIDWMTQSDAIGDWLIERELKDLYAYYHNTKFRETVRNLLVKKLKAHSDKRIMLIGHSMGSIIAYDVLRLLGRKESSIRVDHFVTIGSPLGYPHVVSAIYKDNDLVRTPSNVGRWTNFADRRDSVAMDFRLADDYKANDRGVQVVDVPVINNYRGPAGKPNFHKSYGYLRTPEFSEQLRSFL
jgi:triacylglycerol esterase/lipase EstA (alpha/beta hydrolase family)